MCNYSVANTSRLGVRLGEAGVSSPTRRFLSLLLSHSLLTLVGSGLSIAGPAAAQTQCLSAPNPTRPDWVATDNNPKWGADVEMDGGTVLMLDAPFNTSARRVAVFGPNASGDIVERQIIPAGNSASRIAARGGVLAVAYSTGTVVRLFHRSSDGTYGTATDLSAPAGATGFGSAIALGNDGLTLVVGAPGEGAGPFASSGALYVFSRPATGSTVWTQVARLTPSSGSTGNERFGAAVAIDGDRIAGGGFGITYNIRVASFTRNGATWIPATSRLFTDTGENSTSPFLGLIGEWVILPCFVRPPLGSSGYMGHVLRQVNLVTGTQHSYQVPQGFGPHVGFAARDGVIALHMTTSQSGGTRYSIDYYEFDPSRNLYYPWSYLTSGYSGSGFGSGQYAAAVDSYHYVSTDPSLAWGALTNYGGARIGTALLRATNCNNNFVVDACEIRNGTVADINNNLIPDTCESACRLADFDGDGAVTGDDLGLLLGAWGTTATRFDLAGGGTIDGSDLGALLSSWGVCTN